MRDKFANKILPGDHIVYATRDGNVGRMKSATVICVIDDCLKVRSQGGEGPVITLRTPENIVSLTALEPMQQSISNQERQ